MLSISGAGNGPSATIENWRMHNIVYIILLGCARGMQHLRNQVVRPYTVVHQPQFERAKKKRNAKHLRDLRQLHTPA